MRFSLRRLAQHAAFRSTNVYGNLLEGWTANIVVIDVGWWPMCRYVDPAVSEFAFTSRTATRNMCSRPAENWRSKHMFPLKEKGESLGEGRGENSKGYTGKERVRSVRNSTTSGLLLFVRMACRVFDTWRRRWHRCKHCRNYLSARIVKAAFIMRMD